MQCHMMLTTKGTSYMLQKQMELLDAGLVTAVERIKVHFILSSKDINIIFVLLWVQKWNLNFIFFIREIIKKMLYFTVIIFCQ